VADNIVLNAGAGGATLGSDEVTIGGVLQHVQRVKLVDGADGGTGLLGGDAANGLDVDVTRVGGTVTVAGVAADGAAASGNPVLVAGFDGTNAQSISTTAGGLVQVHDGAGSLTVDAPVATPVFVRLSDGAAAITTLPVSVADAADVTIGAKADAKSTATDTTAVTAMSVWKQISASVQAIATSVAGTLTVATHAVTQSGTWTVQPGNTANTTAWKVDGSAVTQPVDSELTTADLDTGAGTDTRAVVGLAGAASGGAVLVQATSGGALKADVTTVAGTATDTNSGVKSAGTQRVVLATDQPQLTNALKVDGSAVTQPVSGTVSVNTHDVGSITTAVTPGTGAANLGKAEDTAHTSGDTGVAAWAVRRDANTSLVDTTGDYAPLQVDATGSLKVAIISGAGSGGTALADNAAFTPGTTSFTPIGGEVDDTGSTDATENSAGAVRMTVKRAIHVNLRDATGAELSVGGGTQYDEDAVSAGAEKVTMAGVVRRDTAASSSGTDGDISTLATDATGRLWAHVGTVDGGTITTVSTVTNLAQLGGTAVAMNTGVRAAGVQRVTIATDDVVPITDNSGSLTVDAPVGTPAFVRLSDGAAAITTLPVSLAANQSVNVAQVGGASTATAASGVQKVGVVGNAGATVDGTVGAGAAPTNQVVVGSVYNTSAPAPTNGQAMALQADQAGNVFHVPGIATATLSAWTSATALNTTQSIFTRSGAQAVLLHLVQTSTLTVGAVTVEVSYDGTNWVTISADCVLDPTSATLATVSLPYTLQASTNKALLLLVKGAQAMRLKLSTAITGTATVTPNYALLPYAAVQQAVLGTGSNAIGKLAANSGVTIGAVEIAAAQTLSTVSTVTNLSQLGGQAVAMGTGTRSAGTQRVTVATDDVVPASQSGTWTVQPGNTANTTAWLVADQAATSGGCSSTSFLSTAAVQTTQIKGSAGQVYGLHFFNVGAAAVYGRLYNQTGAPASTDTANIVHRFIVPGNTAGAGVVIPIPPGIAFGTGIGWRISAAIADNDTTVLAANGVVGNIVWK
jgi:hypothetical protein